MTFPDQYCSVLYVDYGNVEVVALSLLAELDAAHQQLPYQCIHCQLARVLPRGDSWSTAACEYFLNVVNEQDVVCKVVGREDTMLIPNHLVDLDLSNPVNVLEPSVSTCMVNKSLALLTPAALREVERGIETLGSDQRDSVADARTAAPAGNYNIQCPKVFSTCV